MPQPDYDDLANYNWLMGEIIKHESEQAQALGNLLADRLVPRSVLDVGCGPGIYLLPFKERGISVFGIDGAPEAGQSLAEGEFELVDLRTNWRPSRTFDLTICVEVGEHLRPEYHDNLVRILANATERFCFFSAAPPGQGGEGHYGEATKESWLGRFEVYGLKVHALNPEISTAIGLGQPYAHCGWLRTNGVLLGQ